MDEPLNVTAPHERLFKIALIVAFLAMLGLVALTT